MNQSKGNIDAALMLAIYVILVVATIFIPLIELATMFILPLPFILVTKRHGLKYGLLMFTGAILFSSFIVNIYSLPLTVVFGFAGLMIGYAMYEKAGAYETLARGAIGYVVGIVLLLALTQFFFNVDWSEEIQKLLDTSSASSESLMIKFGADPDGDEIKAIADQTALLKDLLPTIFVTVGAFMSWITVWLAYKFLNRLDKEKHRFPEFRLLRIPYLAIWIYLFAMILLVFVKLEEGAMFSLMVNNIFMIVGALITLHGLSFVFFFVHHKGWPRTISIIILVIALLMPPILNMIRFLGIIDLGFRLRDRMNPKP